MKKGDRPVLGIWFMLASVFCLTLEDALSKWLTTDYSIPQVIFLRSVIGLLVLVPMAHRDGGWSSLKTQSPGLHVFRSLTMAAISFLFVYALRFLPLADITALVLLGPIIVVVLSVPMLNEKMGFHAWVAALLGMLGMLLVVRPGTGIFQPEALMVLLVAFLYSLIIITARSHKETETTTALTFYPQVTLVIASAVFVPSLWQTPGPFEWALFVVLGIVTGFAYLLVTIAVRHASPTVIAPFEYTGLIWAMLFGVLVWNELPDALTMLGIAIITCSGLYVLHRERKRGARSDQDMAEMTH